MPNPKVFFDITIGDQPPSRIVMELFADQVPNVSLLLPHHQRLHSLQVRSVKTGPDTVRQDTLLLTTILCS